MLVPLFCISCKLIIIFDYTSFMYTHLNYYFVGNFVILFGCLYKTICPGYVVDFKQRLLITIADPNYKGIT